MLLKNTQTAFMWGRSEEGAQMDKNIDSQLIDTFLKIGVLGGIGPEATAEFYRKLIEKLQKTGMIKTNTDFPQIIINSIPAPELIHDVISDKELEPYVLGIKELDNFGVDFIVMVCNTIHLYYELIQKKIKMPIIDLRDEMKKYLIEQKIKSAFILATPETIKKGLYRFDAIEIMEPNKNEMNQLSNTIFLFNKGIKKQEQIRKVRKIYQKHLCNNVTHILLGCTEFAVMLENENIPKINTLDVLVDATIKKASALKQRKNYKLSNSIIKSV